MQFHSLHISSSQGNCKAFLKGFPIFHESDDKTIVFVICIAKHLKLNEKFNNIETKTLVDELHEQLQTIIITSMRIKINDFLDNYKQLQMKVKNTLNMRFLPILSKIKMPTYKSLMKRIDKSSKILSNEDYILYLSKLHELSYYIQDSIQEVTSKETPILRGRTIYTENFCCIDNDLRKNPLEYFKNKSESLNTYNTHAIEIQSFIKTHNKSKKPNLYYDNNNTRFSTLHINHHFSDDVLKNVLKTLNIEYSDDNVKLYIQGIQEKNIVNLSADISVRKSKQFEELLNVKMSENKDSTDLK